MITHIVCWKVHNQAAGLAQSEILDKLKADLEALPASIQEILSLSVGVNAKTPDEKSDADSDLVLLSTFADWESLATYQAHPEHQKVVEFVKQVVTERRVVDFES